jgi:hypothetical protein
MLYVAGVRLPVAARAVPSAGLSAQGTERASWRALEADTAVDANAIGSGASVMKAAK